MCGLIGIAVNNKRNVRDRVKTIYENQKSRGRQGAGFALKRGNAIFRIRHQNPETALKTFALWQGYENGDLTLFHHRYPTSTPNKAHLNHPLANEDKSVYLIHNGIIHNDMKLYEKMKSRHRFETVYRKDEGEDEIITDSEVMVHILEEELKKRSFAMAFRRLAERVEGMFAVAVLIKPYNKIFLFKNSYNPIVVFKDDDGNYYFASEFPERSGFTEVRKLEEGELGCLSHRGYTKVRVFEDIKRQIQQKVVYYFGGAKDRVRETYRGWDDYYYGGGGVCRFCGVGEVYRQGYCEECFKMVVGGEQ